MNIVNLTDRVYKRGYWLLNDLLWKLPKTIRSLIIGNPDQKLGITVTMTTYIERFESCFIPALTHITELFPQEQIIVVANGHYDRVRQEDYLVKLRAFCGKFPNVELWDFMEPISVCKMVNIMILNTKSRVMLGVNDDMHVSPYFKQFIIKSGILSERIATINGSWCRLVINQGIIKQVGWWDERLPEIGGDDDDYAARCALAGIEIANYKTIRIVSSRKKTRKRDTLNSWGKDMTKQIGGYSSLNYDFLLNQKWETSDTPFPGATFVPNRAPIYWKLRPGMETPDFYPGKMK